MAIGRIRAVAIFSISVLCLAPPSRSRVRSSYSDYDGRIDRYLTDGANALAAGDLTTAVRHYEACLVLDPHQRHCCVNLASSLVDANDAESDGAAARQRTARAVSLLRRVLRRHPADGDAAFNLALILQDSSRAEDATREAAGLYQIAVEAADEDGGEGERWDALANLAAARQELGEFLGPYGALRSYERAAVLLEGMAAEHGAVLDQMRNDAAAAARERDDEVYEETRAQLVAIDAYLSKLYYGHGTILSALSPADCLALANDGPALPRDEDVGAHGSAAKTACDAHALTSMRRAAELDGNNAVARHMLAAMTGGEGDDGERGGRDRASNEFVSDLFDEFADTFDKKLGALGYQVPQLIGEAASLALRSTGEEAFRSALDAGCGTGLAGRFLRPLVGGALVGVDLSTGMLARAAACTLLAGCGAAAEDAAADGGGAEDDARARTPLYDRLLSLDLETAPLRALVPEGASDGFDLIVAADVLVYFGDLRALLANFRRLSDDRSFLIFSCERPGDGTAPWAGWQLQGSGRYAHSKAYVTGVAESAGYVLVDYQEIVPRMEKGEEVQGHMFVFAVDGSAEEDVGVAVQTVMEEL